MEMLCANPRHIGGDVYMRWTQLKRALPLTDTYYDVRDAVLDPGAFDVDDLVVRKRLVAADSTLEALAENASGEHHCIAMDSASEILRRGWPTGAPPALASTLLEKIGRVVERGERAGAVGLDVILDM